MSGPAHPPPAGRPLRIVDADHNTAEAVDAALFDVSSRGHGGDMLRIDRKGRSSERIEHPAIAVDPVPPAVADAYDQRLHQLVHALACFDRRGTPDGAAT